MKSIKQGNLTPIKFRQALPSALFVLLLGAFYAPEHNWSWQGELGQGAWWAGVLAGVVLYALAYWLTLSPKAVTKSVRDILVTLRQMFKNFSWTQIVILSILAGVGEELLMRGALQSWLDPKIGTPFAILLTAVVFGLLHFMNIAYVVLTFCIGIIFGVMFHLSESMIFVMLAHTVYDILAFAAIIKYPHLVGLGDDQQTLLIRDE